MHSVVEHRTDGVALDGVATGSCRLTGAGEESDPGHPQRLGGSIGTHHRAAGRGTVGAVTHMLLVRHGQSEWNATGRWQGNADPDLTELGRLQALHAAARIGTVDLIVASPLIRAFETAQIISTQIGVGPVVVEPDLAERDAGEWEGLTRAEIESEWPGYLGHDRWPPGYEGHDELMQRILGALGRIESEYRGAELLVLPHGGIIGALERDADLPWERMPNLGARRLTHHGDRHELGERLVLVDDDELTIPTQI